MTTNYTPEEQEFIQEIVRMIAECANGCAVFTEECNSILRDRKIRSELLIYNSLSLQKSLAVLLTRIAKENLKNYTT